MTRVAKAVTAKRQSRRTAITAIARISSMNVGPRLSVGVIGLGAGTLAAYARKEDTFDFWDIDPKALRVARENFTYVAESAGKIDLILRDGRKALEESKQDYDVIVLDAFTGDGVPGWHRLDAVPDGHALVSACADRRGDDG
eukprot:gene65714-89900_t